MQKLKSIGLFAFIFLTVYGLLVFPDFKLYESYSNFFREKASSLFSTWGEKGQVAFHEETNGEFDTKVMIGNREVFLPSGEQRGGYFNYCIRYRGFMASMFIMALFMATPIRLVKRTLLMILGLVLLNLILFVNLYIMILNKFVQTPELQLHQLGKRASYLIDFIDDFLNNGFGVTFFIVAFIWISLVSIFEKEWLKSFSGKIIV